MHFYSAIVNDQESDSCILIPPVRMLASFHYYKKKMETVRGFVEKGFEIFIDSGAFSSASLGVEVNIDDYCKFILDTKAPMYAALDVIGDAKATYANTKYMEQRYGLQPIPTFHLGGNTDDLIVLLKEYDYIALGGLVFSSNVMRYCDEVWSIILKEKPKIRVHGFGLTNFELMERYPWYSVDSSSYKSSKRFGRQQILWNGLEFKMFTEEEYIKVLADMGYENIETMENRKRNFIYDLNSVQSYKIFVAHLTELHRLKDFSYLTAQEKLF